MRTRCLPRAGAYLHSSIHMLWLVATPALGLASQQLSVEVFPGEVPEWIWPLIAGSIVAAIAIGLFVRTRRRRVVFISYRRQDSAVPSAEIFGYLAQRFGKHVFRDVASIRPGEDFRRAIQRTLHGCDAVVVVIGPEWLSCRNGNGKARLHEPDDVVRSEVSSALDSGVLVIPILVKGAAMPKAPELPTDLRALADLQAVSVNEQPSGLSLIGVADAVAAAPVRRTPSLVLISHVAIVVLLVVFFLAGGFRVSEFTTSLAIVAPLLAATGAVAAMHALDKADVPARIRQVPVTALLVPLAFVAVIAGLIVLKALNIGITSFDTFRLCLGAVELLFGVHTGLVLSSLFENRRRT